MKGFSGTIEQVWLFYFVRHFIKKKIYICN